MTDSYLLIRSPSKILRPTWKDTACMRVKFTVKADDWDEIDLPDDLTDSGVQQELRQWVLDVANFWFEIKKE